MGKLIQQLLSPFSSLGVKILYCYGLKRGILHHGYGVSLFSKEPKHRQAAARVAYFRQRNSGCSAEQKTLGIPFRTVPLKRKMFGIPLRVKKLKLTLGIPFIQ
jgi:hypothetical protein